MEIIKATKQDIEKIETLYNDLNDYLAKHMNYPGWIKGIYPTKETAVLGVEEGSLYIIKDDDYIAGSIILRNTPEKGYAKTDWEIVLDDHEVLVIYTLVVHPDYLKMGIGKQLIEFAIKYGMQLQMKAIRLDVYEKNLPAISLYKKYGFEYIDTIDLGYGEYGLDKFELYQKLL